jgi:single-stranded-DNA-specific exonuclease
MDDKPGRMERVWTLMEPPLDGGENLSRGLGLHPVTALLLARRGIRTVSAASDFLNPSTATVPDPFLLPDAEQAVDRLIRAIDSGESILVHGDYDVDGVTSAALLTRVLGKLGAKVRPFVPSRARDGYGVSVAALERAAAEGVSLILTADCGITAFDACTRARQLGLDVVVSDHHEPADTLPEAFAVVDPLVPGSSYPFRGLAGVGVAYKLCQALCLRRGVDLDALHRHFLDLVALGTVSDCVPLLDENRAYVYHGLRSMGTSQKEGIRALLRLSGLGESLGTEDVGFRLGPRINAAGRLAEADEALELLLTRDSARAEELATILTERNTQRQQEQRRIQAEAIQAIFETGISEDAVLVVGREGWHPGVIGIVAGKLVETFYRPAVVLTLRDGHWHGSARGIPGFHWARALEELGEDLVRGGGHAMAAGLSLPRERLREFRVAVNELAQQWLSPADLQPRLEVEAEVPVEQLSFQLAQEVVRLAPFGEGNPEPVLMSSRVRLDNVRCVGEGGRHLRAELRGAPGPVSVVGFGMGDAVSSLSGDRLFKICYNLRVSAYNGSGRAEIVLRDLPAVQE